KWDAGEPAGTATTGSITAAFRAQIGSSPSSRASRTKPSSAVGVQGKTSPTSTLWTPTADDGFVVRAIKPEQALVFGEETQFTWAFVLQPIDETSTRLVTRTRMLYENLAQRLMLELSFRPIDFGMKQRQLLNLKRSVEAKVVA